MAQPNSIFQQYSLAEATAFKEQLNADYTAAGIETEVVAVSGQVNNHFAVPIPKSFEAEYEASDDEKKNNFALFSSIAQGPEYQGIDFLTAFTTEYNKVY